MAISTCVKCGKMGMFEIREAEPSHSAFKLMYLQCSMCGGVAGVLEYYNTGAKLDKLEKQVGQLESHIESIDAALRTLASRMR